MLCVICLGRSQADTGLISYPATHTHTPLRQKHSQHRWATWRNKLKVTAVVFKGSLTQQSAPEILFYSRDSRNVKSRKSDILLYNSGFISLHNPKQVPPKTASSLPKPKREFRMLICIPAEIPTSNKKEEYFYHFYSQR